MLPKYRKPKQDEIEACSQYLNKEIDLINPAILSPLGYYPTKYILEKYGISVPRSKSEFLAVYGKVFQTENKKILPLAHPATLLYNEFIWEEMTENYKKMKILLESISFRNGQLRP
jgi:DNA polymerase